MESQLAEAHTFPVQSYANSFFTRYPTDTRFLNMFLFTSFIAILGHIR